MLKYENVDLYKKYKFTSLKYPLTVYLKVTSRCMLKCKFCSQAGKREESIPLESAKKYLEELKNYGIIYVCYTGGEPLLYNELYDLIEYGYMLGYKQTLVTNGMLFSDEKNRKLAKFLVSVGISIHGMPSIHDELTGVTNSYNIVMKNIRLLQEENSNIAVIINCTAVKQNTSYENFKFLARLCGDNDWKLTIARLNYIGNGNMIESVKLNNMLEIVDAINREGNDIKISNCIASCLANEKFRYLTHGCGAGVSIVAIESNGDVRICASSEYVLGNLNEKSFEKIWNGSVMKKFRRLKWLHLYCKECKSFLTCKGGCKAELSGEFWKRQCDASVKIKFEEEWKKIKNKKLELNCEMIRRDGINKYVIGCIPAKTCNMMVKRLLLKINGNNTANEIVHMYSERVEIKEFLIILSIDKVINIIDG